MAPDSSTGRVLFIHNASLPTLGADSWIHELIIRRSARAEHDVPSLTAAADIPIRPSFEERFGLVYAEATMAMKQPAVAFDDDGRPEVVGLQKCPPFLAQGDVPALAANLRRLVTDKALRAWMGAYGSEQVEQVEQGFIPWRLAGGVLRGYQPLLGQS